MPETVGLVIDGETVHVPAGTTVAAAIGIKGEASARRSLAGEPRGPLCGMGICFECRVTVDGRAHRRACMLLCEDGMEVRTQ